MHREVGEVVAPSSFYLQCQRRYPDLPKIPTYLPWYGPIKTLCLHSVQYAHHIPFSIKGAPGMEGFKVAALPFLHQVPTMGWAEILFSKRG